VISGRDVNDRNRWLLRGQLLFEPSTDFSMRVVADYTRRREECCAATYLPARDFTAAGSQPSTIAAIQRALGAVINDDPFARNFDHARAQLRQRRRRLGPLQRDQLESRRSEPDLDHRLSLQQLFAGRTQPSTISTSSTATATAVRISRFKTFTQELRLQGEAMAGGSTGWSAAILQRAASGPRQPRYGADYSRYGNCLVADRLSQRLLDRPASRW
jgi:iron complex outermembrane recepter protein